MSKARYRHALPQLGDARMLTDGGLESTLIFHQRIELPHFAAFDLLRTREGREELALYYSRYLELAAEARVGFVLDTPTWRANPDWATLLGYDRDSLAAANREAVELIESLRWDHERGNVIVLNGVIGPRGDGYQPEALMDAQEAEAYHTDQVEVFEAAGIDMISAITMTHAGEAHGIARACAKRDVPCAISFTVETNGRLPSGQALGEAIQELDADTDNRPVYYMINCAHPDHFLDTVSGGEAWTKRIRGVRANASRMSHVELDACTDLDDGDPVDLAAGYADLLILLPELRVLGGCCGTDHRHVGEIAKACLEPVA